MGMNEELLKTALLGTEKYPVKPPTYLQQQASAIAAKQEDKEDGFLQIAALSLAYETAGNKYPEHALEISTAPNESLEYASPDFSASLRSFMRQRDPLMLQFALKACAQKELLVSPDLVPSLLQQATNTNKNIVLAICGERGKWLAKMNPQWAPLYGDELNTEEWETGSFETRKELLQNLRSQRPEKAADLLSVDFDKESAQKRLELLDCFTVGLGSYDEAFLTSLGKDRSSKVKEKAHYLLKLIPGSALNQVFLNFLSDLMHVKEERRLLVAKKKVVGVDSSQMPSSELFEQGLEKISSEKGFDDHWFWAMQCLEVASPQWIFDQYGESATDLLKLLLAQSKKDLFIPYLIRWAVHFEQKDLAFQLAELDLPFNESLAEVLSSEDALTYRSKHLSEYTERIVLQLVAKEQEFPEPLAIELMKLLKQKPYNITAATYRKMALYFPLSLKRALDSLAQRIGDGHFDLAFLKNQVTEMVRILEIREHMNL